MKTKFDKYFDHLPYLLSLATIIDPRCKEIDLQEFLECIFVDQTQFVPIMQTCNRLFEEYMVVASVNTRTHTTLAVSFRGERLSVFLVIKSRRISQHTSVSSFELQHYLESPSVDDSDDFDILEWWKQNKLCGL